VEVVCLSDELGCDDTTHPFPVHRVRRRQFWPLRVANTVVTIWRAALRQDLVYVSGLGAESAVSAILAGRPTVHKIVGDYAWERAVGRRWFSGTLDDYQRSRKSFTLKALDLTRTIPLMLARRIIVPSRYLGRIVGGWGIPTSKIRVVYNAVAAGAAESVPVLPAWPGKTLITVCRLVPWKGVDALIRLLPGLPDTRLVIAGDGQLRGELIELARRAGVGERVLFLGDVPPAEVAGYLRQADAFVLNSTYEGLPHVVLEAMTVGTPVVATDAGGTGEVVENEVTGLLVPVANPAALRTAVERLWREPALGRLLASAATRRLEERFDFDVMVSATEALLAMEAGGTAVGPRAVPEELR
jgi:glycosyltransferase involved in cell wall biosynthesis